MTSDTMRFVNQLHNAINYQKVVILINTFQFSMNEWSKLALSFTIWLESHHADQHCELQKSWKKKTQ